MATQCPRCKKEVPDLFPVDPAALQKLMLVGSKEHVPVVVCFDCRTQIDGSISHGSVLLAQEKAKEENKLSLWKGRVGLLKKARASMTNKMYADAATSYEKYIKVLEIVLGKPEAEITPQVFKEKAATKELTVVANAYWDLLRIYDTHSKYRKRQAMAAQKLTQFLPFTPIGSDILKRATSFRRSARNPEAIDAFIKNSGVKKGSCFIATAAFADPFSMELLQARSFRDRTLRKSRTGRALVYVYYCFAEGWPSALVKMPIIRSVVRLLIRLFLDLI